MAETKQALIALLGSYTQIMPGIAKRLTFSWGKRQHTNTPTSLRNFTVAIPSDFLFNIRQKSFWLRLSFGLGLALIMGLLTWTTPTPRPIQWGK